MQKAKKYMGLMTMFAITVILFFIPHFLYAQTDSLGYKVGAAASNPVTTGILTYLGSLIHWPTFVASLVGSVIPILTAVQFVLKAIPTANSVTINGWLGAVLSWFTAFQKDVLTTQTQTPATTSTPA